MTRKGIYLAAGALVLVGGWLAYTYRWHRLEYYVPDPSIAFQDAFRTMAEHDSVMHNRRWPYVVDLDAGDARLIYYGSRHTKDPADEQIQHIKQLWNDLHPTVAVTENRLGFFIGGLNQGVSVFHEFGALFALARRDQIPIYTLEPPWNIEVQEMKAAFPAEEVTLFYTLRVFLSERPPDASDEEVDQLAAALLQKRGSRPGLAGSLPTLEALDSLWARHYAALGPWRTLPPEAIWPSSEPSRLQQMANLANEIRDRHAVRVIIDLVRKGERVFALAGGSHVVKQEPVLRAAFSGGVAQ